MLRKPVNKAYRDQQRKRLVRLGVGGRQLIEQLVSDLMHHGCRPRQAWRMAWELTQGEVAAQFNQIRGDPDSRMRGSRICEYEKWPRGGIRPPVRALETLAIVYGTTWDRLVDVDDLESMPARDRQAFLDLSGPRYDERSIAGRERRPAAPPGSVPPQSDGGLPGDVTHFTGRDEPMTELRARITEQAPHGTVVTIYAIDGMAGVGKTAFARHAAQEFAERYPDGAVWVDLYGHTPGMQPRGPSSALEQMLLQLGVPPEAVKADPAERQDQWHRHIHAKRALIVLDNAATSDQVLPLLPEAPGCLVLITSRRKLTGVTDAYPLSLDVLGWDEAEQLFIKLLGAQRCADRGAVRQILAACGRLPLALRLIAGRLRHHRGEQLADFATDFVDQTAALDAFVAEHLSVRAAFEWSYRPLAKEQRRAFRLLGWHPGPEITPVVIAAMADVPPAHGRQLLRELVDHNLLDQLSVPGVPGGPRYRMHDLVRLYAQERADAEEPAAQRLAAVDRLASSYLAITREADRLLRPYIAGLPPKSTAHRAVLAFADAAQARAWLTVERHNLLGVVRTMSPTAEAAALSSVLAIHFLDFGFSSDVRSLFGQALTLAQLLGDRRGEIGTLRGLGEVGRLVGEYGEARAHYTKALTLARQLGYRRDEVDALRGLGEVERLTSEYAKARECHTQALALARRLGYRRAEADALWGLGQVEWLVGGYGRARECYSEALALARQLGYRFGEADGLLGLGQVERLVGEYGQAREYHTEALTLAQHTGDRRVEADALWGLGDVEQMIGKYDQAREYHSQSLALSRQLGYRFGELSALRGLGDVARSIGEYDHARAYHAQALTLSGQLGDRRAEAEALCGLGHVAASTEEPGQACDLWRKALKLYKELGVPFPLPSPVPVPSPDMETYRGYCQSIYPDMSPCRGRGRGRGGGVRIGVSMWWVGSTAELPILQGASGVPDRATFEVLAARDDVPGALGAREVKFLVLGVDGDEPRLYFANTNTYSYHYDFATGALGVDVSLAEFNAQTYFRDDRSNLAGTIIAHDGFEAPDGGRGLYAMEFWPTDPVKANHVALAFRAIGQAMPFARAQLAYHPAGDTQEALYQQERSQFDQLDVRVVLTSVLFGNVSYTPLNLGEGYGTLRVVDPAQVGARPATIRDVAIFGALPNDISHLAGIISETPQTPLSHINLKAKQNDTPNAYVRGASTDPRITPFLDQLVHYAVTPDDFTLESATQAQVDTWLERLRPPNPQQPRRDLCPREIIDLDQLDNSDTPAFGAKAANLGELRNIFPAELVPDGYAIPFSFYDDFMAANCLYDEAARMIADPGFRSDPAVREAMLDDFRRTRIRRGELPSELVNRISELQARFGDGVPIRCRSSTNNEDVEGFNGAGLYDSYTHRPDEGALEKTIKQVWASLWNFRAFDERDFYRIDHLHAAMGVAVHRNFDDEVANGVAVTKNPYEPDWPGFYVNVQVGESLVTNPDPSAIPDELLISAIGPQGEWETQFIRHSSLTTEGAPVLSMVHLDELRRALQRLHAHFKRVYQRQDDDTFAMDIEFKIDLNDQLVIKQARPWVD